MSPILIAVCLSAPGEEKEIDFLQKSNVSLVTPGIPRTKSLGEQIDFEKSIRRVQILRRSRPLPDHQSITATPGRRPDRIPSAG